MKWRVLLALVAVLAVGVWWMTSPRDSWRYKMTVEVETPEGVRTGSAVREVRYQGRNGFFIAESQPQWRVHGEAIAVDMPGGRTVYALLRGNDGGADYGARIADMAYSDDGRVHGSPGPVQLYPTAANRPLLRNSDPLPMLVMFADPKDPKTVERIDPRNISAIFGPGYALKSITLQITDEAVTTGLEKRLPSFGKGTGFDRWYASLSWSDPHRVGLEDFRQGDPK
ncbi:MAG TPA: hypothetical protein VGC56_10365 [Allosphingosinicella sp.]|jgi:hypothetical protein